MISDPKDILTKYRIPVDQKQLDYTLQLPDDSDSSNFSNSIDQEGEEEEGMRSSNKASTPAQNSNLE